MKYVAVGLSFLNGAWMLIDGIYVLVRGKYIGPEKPGPWASLLGLTGVDVFKLGPAFILFGAAWLIFAVGLFAGSGWSKGFGLALSILTLWYLPFGTLISIVVFCFLVFFYRS